MWRSPTGTDAAGAATGDASGALLEMGGDAEAPDPTPLRSTLTWLCMMGRRKDRRLVARAASCRRLGLDLFLNPFPGELSFLLSFGCAYLRFVEIQSD